MNHEEQIVELEEKERALTVQTIEGARAGAVSPSLHQELAEVRDGCWAFKTTELGGESHE